MEVHQSALGGNNCHRKQESVFLGIVLTFSFSLTMDDCVGVEPAEFFHRFSLTSSSAKIRIKVKR